MPPIAIKNVLGLDIGSSKICAAVCDLATQGNLHIQGVGNSISSGMQQGRIVDADELRTAIERAVKRAW